MTTETSLLCGAAVPFTKVSANEFPVTHPCNHPIRQRTSGPCVVCRQPTPQDIFPDCHPGYEHIDGSSDHEARPA